MISALPSAGQAGGSRYCPIRLFKRAEILAMLAAGRASADIARIFRVHRATASRIAAELRTPFQCDGLY
jgi:hypothetical protein